MYRLFVLTLMFLSKTSAYDLTEVDLKCIRNNNKTLSNNFLIGTWYQMFEFTGESLAPRKYCPTMEFTKPTKGELLEYKKKYNSTDVPYSFDDNPTLLRENRMKGLVMGNTEAKFYVLDPKEAVVLRGGFSSVVYKRLNDNFIIFYSCEMRGNVKWLLSRYRNATIAETDALINNTPDFRNMKVMQFCVDKVEPYPIMQNGRFCSCHCCSV